MFGLILQKIKTILTLVKALTSILIRSQEALPALIRNLLPFICCPTQIYSKKSFASLIQLVTNSILLSVRRSGFMAIEI